MPVPRRLCAVAASGVLVAVLAGCASPGTGETEQTSPLSEYFSAVYGTNMSEEEQQQKFEADQRQREELIAACMTEEGFEYSPNVSTTGMSFGSGDEWKPDDREWVSQYGYGIINYPGRDEQTDPAAEEYVDPNQGYVDSLSESEQTAFYEALYGPGPSEEEMSSSDPVEYDWTTAGCSGAADHEVSGEDPTQSDEFKSLNEAISTFYTNMESSPEFAMINTAWAACMDEAGEPGFTNQSDAVTSISEAYNAFWESGASDTDAGATPAPVSPDSPELTALGEKEIALALTDLECRDKTDYREKQTAAQFAAEEAFIADHKAELDAMKAAAEQARS